MIDFVISNLYYISSINAVGISNCSQIILKNCIAKINANTKFDVNNSKIKKKS